MITALSTLSKPSFFALIFAASITSAGAQDVANSAPDTLSETYRDWVVVCQSRNPQEGQPVERQCEMTQELRQQEGGQRVLSIALRPEGDAGLLTMITPFGLNVRDQVAIEVDGVTIIQAPFQTCLPAGCIVQAQIDQTSLDAMRAGEAVIVRLPTTAGEPFQVNISVLGFTAAWNRLMQL